MKNKSLQSKIGIALKYSAPRKHEKCS